MQNPSVFVGGFEVQIVESIMRDMTSSNLVMQGLSHAPPGFKVVLFRPAVVGSQLFPIGIAEFLLE
jgi:hypothetical protein